MKASIIIHSIINEQGELEWPPKGTHRKAKHRTDLRYQKASLEKKHHSHVILTRALFPYVSLKFGKASSFFSSNKAFFFPTHLARQGSRRWIYFSEKKYTKVMWSITTTYASYYPLLFCASIQNSTFDITLITFHLLITKHNSFLSDHYEQQRGIRSGKLGLYPVWLINCVRNFGLNLKSSEKYVEGLYTVDLPYQI